MVVYAQFGKAPKIGAAGSAIGSNHGVAKIQQLLGEISGILASNAGNDTCGHC